MTARNVKPTIGPTPGTVINRWTIGSAAARCLVSASCAAMTAPSASSVVSTGVSCATRAAGNARARHRATVVSLLPEGSR